MSNTNSDSGVVPSSPLYSASDISVSTTNIESHWILDGDIENQCYLQVPELPPFPDGWKPPSQTCARLCFTAICWFSVGKSDLEKFWLNMEGKSWKEYNQLERDSNLPLHVHLLSLCLVIIFASAMREPPVFIRQPVDYRYYCVFLVISVLCSVLVLSCIVLLSLLNGSIELREEIENEGQKQFQLSRHEVLIYVVLSRIVSLGPLVSWFCLFIGDTIRLWHWG